MFISSCHHFNLSFRQIDLSSRRIDSPSRRVVLSLVIFSPQLLVSSCRPFNSSSRHGTSRHFKHREYSETGKTNYAQAQVPTCDYGEFSFKIDELNAVKDLLRDPVSRIDQIPPQNSQTQNYSIYLLIYLLLID